MAFSERLKEFREGEKATQARFAEIFNVSIPGYQNYEYGNSHPTADQLMALAKEYPALDLNWLVSAKEADAMAGVSLDQLRNELSKMEGRLEGTIEKKLKKLWGLIRGQWESEFPAKHPIDPRA